MKIRNMDRSKRTLIIPKIQLIRRCSKYTLVLYVYNGLQVMTYL